MKPSAEMEAARNRIHDLLAELADILGPGADGAELEAGEDPEGQLFLSEWVIVTAWVDETGHSFTSRYGSPGIALHHLKGLLHEGLFGFED